MPKVNIYLKNSLHSELDTIVKHEQANGATRSDINMSSLAAELIRLGLMIYKNRDGEDAFDLQEYRRDLIKLSSGGKEASVISMAMLTAIHEKIMGSGDINKIEDDIDKNLKSVDDAENEIEIKHFS